MSNRLSAVCFGYNVNVPLNGQALESLTYAVEGGDSGETIGVDGVACSGGGYYKQRNFTMTITTFEGNSATYTATGNSGVDPNRSAQMSRGSRYIGAASTGTCSASGPPCYNYHFKIVGFEPSATVNIACYNSTGSWRNFDVAVDGNGSWEGENCFLGPEANNDWDGPYYFIVRDRYGSVRSNDDRW